MRDINKIILHCSDTPEGRFNNAADIDQWHKARGWSGIGYHYVILLDGTIEEGRPEQKVGAHAYGHNSRSIGICYIGGKNKEQTEVKDTRTEAQKCELENLIRTLADKYPDAKVIGHNEVSEKACPSFDVQDWLDEIFF